MSNRDRAEMEQLLTRFSELMGVPVLQIKAIMEKASLTQARPRRESFAHLRGVKITVSQAAEKYRVPLPTVRAWTDKGYITVLDTAHPKQLDEADVAFCVAVKAQRVKLGITSKVKLFDESGEPVYDVKYPLVARISGKPQKSRKKKSPNGRR
jgi:hypothetical protein